MTSWSARWNPLRRARNRAAWHGSAHGSADGTDSTGAGVPTGMHACGRAILPGQDSDHKWAEACRTWDDVRADIRRVPDQTFQADAWHATAQALRRLRDHIRRQYSSDFEEVHRDVDY